MYYPEIGLIAIDDEKTKQKKFNYFLLILEMNILIHTNQKLILKDYKNQLFLVNFKFNN